jgi:hypothetical protein
VEVGAGMAVFGGVAAADMSTFRAHAQVDPGVSSFQAVFAALAAGFDVLYVIFSVSTGSFSHSILHFLVVPNIVPLKACWRRAGLNGFSFTLKCGEYSDSSGIVALPRGSG